LSIRQPAHIKNVAIAKSVRFTTLLLPDRGHLRQVEQITGVEPVFLSEAQAINYASNRASFRSGEIRVLDSTGNVDHVIQFTEADRTL
jgi:hypothetical protein